MKLITQSHFPIQDTVVQRYELFTHPVDAPLIGQFPATISHVTVQNTLQRDC
jgi:hypothetical protein